MLNVLQQNIEVKDIFFLKTVVRIKLQTNIIEHQNQPSHNECVLTIAVMLCLHELLLYAAI